MTVTNHPAHAKGCAWYDGQPCNCGGPDHRNPDIKPSGSADPNVAELRRLDAAATPGPWKRRTPVERGLFVSEAGRIVYADGGTPEDVADAALIAAMRNALPALLDAAGPALRFGDEHPMMYDAEGTVMEGTMGLREALERVRHVVTHGGLYLQPGNARRLTDAIDEEIAALSEAVPEPEIAALDALTFGRVFPNDKPTARDLTVFQMTVGYIKRRALSRPLSQTAVRDSHQVEADLPDDTVFYAVIDGPLAYWRQRKEQGDPLADDYIDAFASARHNIEHALEGRAAATPEADLRGVGLDASTPSTLRDAARYRRLRLLGVAPLDTPQLSHGTVLRFQSLDEFTDDDLTRWPTRGEAEYAADVIGGPLVAPPLSRPVEADPRDKIIENLKVALRVATHSPHDQAGEPVEGFPVCSVCGAIQTDARPVEADLPDAERAALDAGTHEPAVDDFGNQYLARAAATPEADHE